MSNRTVVLFSSSRYAPHTARIPSSFTGCSITSGEKLNGQCSSTESTRPRAVSHADRRANPATRHKVVMQRTQRRISLSFVPNGSRPVTKVLLRLSAKGSGRLPLRFRFTLDSASRRWLWAVLSSILSPPLWVVVILILVITTHSMSTFQQGPALITVLQEQSGAISSGLGRAGTITFNTFE